MTQENIENNTQESTQNNQKKVPYYFISKLIFSFLLALMTWWMIMLHVVNIHANWIIFILAWAFIMFLMCKIYNREYLRYYSLNIFKVLLFFLPLTAIIYTIVFTSFAQEMWWSIAAAGGAIGWIWVILVALIVWLVWGLIIQVTNKPPKIESENSQKKTKNPAMIVVFILWVSFIWWIIAFQDAEPDIWQNWEFDDPVETYQEELWQQKDTENWEDEEWQEQEHQQEDVQEVYSMWEKFEVWEFEISVDNYENMGDHIEKQFQEEQTSGKFVRVDLSITNISNEEESRWMKDINLIDNEWNSYWTYNMQTILDNYNPMLSINPNMTENNSHLFEIPDNVDQINLSIEETLWWNYWIVELWDI